MNQEHSGSVCKAVIPVAGKGTRHFPAGTVVPKAFFPLVDIDGVTRATVHIILRQARAGGIARFALVVAAGQEEVFRRYFTRHEDALAGRLGPQARQDAEEIADLAGRITYIVQPEPLGLGHAVWCAREFAAGDPFMVMLGDYVYMPRRTPTGQGLSPVVALRQAFELCTCLDAGGERTMPASVTGVRASPASDLAFCGALAGRKPDLSELRLGGADLDAPEDLQDRLRLSERLYRVVDIVEKPSLDLARARLVTPGLEPDRFLTHYGLYIFGPPIFEALDRVVRQRSRGEVQLTAAQELLVRAGASYYALRLDDSIALDIGTPAGLIETQRCLTRPDPEDPTWDVWLGF